MTETTSDVAAGEAEESEVITVEGEVTEAGRYIPYGGGTMGWFENSGVLKCEKPNNYLFYTVMESDLIRSKQFERWGEHFNRRGDRARVRKELGVTVKVGRSTIRGSTRDISMHGVRLQFFEEFSLKKGDSTHIKLHEGDSDDVFLEFDARVVWSEKIGRIRPIWAVGMTFVEMTPEIEARLRQLRDA